MVWGMELPTSFGEFWPDGDFEGETPDGAPGWENRLRLHYLSQSREEQRKLLDYGDESTGFGAGYYGFYVNGKFRVEAGAQNFDLGLPYSPIEPHEPPKFFATVKSYANLGSFIKFNDRIVAVDEDLQEIIERLEPEIHGLYPIEIKMPRGKTFPKSFYTLVFGQYLDSFSVDNGNLEKTQIKDYVFTRSAIGGAHLWRDRRFPLLTCLSDELISEIKKADLRIPRHVKMTEI